MYSFECDGTGCVCKDKTSDSTHNTGTCPSSNPAMASADNCKNICLVSHDDQTLAEDEKCMFYKYVEDVYSENQSRKCYLMNKDQCNLLAHYPCHQDMNCVSGGIDCDGDVPITTTTPTPAGYCETDRMYHASQISDNYLHWYCY